MYLSLLLSVNIIHLSSAKHDIRMKHDGSESKEIDGANLSRSFLDPPPFEGTCATLRYRGFQQQYQVEQSVGYCTPWGGAVEAIYVARWTSLTKSRNMCKMKPRMHAPMLTLSITTTTATMFVLRRNAPFWQETSVRGTLGTNLSTKVSVLVSSMFVSFGMLYWLNSRDNL